MFEPQEEKKEVEIKPAPAFDPKMIPVHTMKDDLNVSSSKVNDPRIVLFDEKTSSPSVNSNSAAINDFGPKSQASSPFAENSFPAKAPDKQEEAKASQIKLVSSSGIAATRAPEVPSAAVMPRISNVSKNQNSLNTSKTSIAPKEPAKKGNGGKIVKMLVFFLLVLGFLGGGYYFYMTRYNNPTEDIVVIPPTEIPNDVPVEIPQEPLAIEKFSATKPNYLMLDVEKMGVAEIQNLFVRTAAEIKEDGKTVPVEFVITDNNNNPIAFKIFARLMGLTFSTSLLDNYQDDFSVYILSDKGKVRLGLNILSKDPTKALADLKKEEKMLPGDLSPLFLGELTKKLNLSFSDNQYKGVAIRYLNLDDQNSLSIDYFLYQGRIVLATSKNAAWAIIDKMTTLGQ